MDIGDTPEEAAFRAEARAFLEQHAERKTPGVTSFDELNPTTRTGCTTTCAAAGSGSTLYDNGWAGITWPKEFGGRGGTGIQQAIFAEEERTSTCRPACSPSASAWSARRSSRTAPTSSRSATSTRCCAATRCGASCSASRAPAPTSPRLGTRACATATSGSSTGRRCGPRARSTPTGASCSPAPIPTRRSTAASRTSSSTCARPASTSARCGRSPASRTSTRCSSPTCASPPQNVLGEVNGGWAVAHTTLANERAVIGGGGGGRNFDDGPRAGPGRGLTDDPLPPGDHAGVHPHRHAAVHGAAPPHRDQPGSAARAGGVGAEARVLQHAARPVTRDAHPRPGGHALRQRRARPVRAGRTTS